MAEAAPCGACYETCVLQIERRMGRSDTGWRTWQAVKEFIKYTAKERIPVFTTPVITIL
jgi:hypothetical protein